MKETRTLVLNSQTATNRIGSNTRNYQYNVNWTTILPKPENINQKYLVRFSFITPSTKSFGEVFTVSIDFGGSNMYDQTNNKSTFMGCVYPVMNTTTSTAGTNTVFYYSKATTIDNIPVTIEYPNNSMITVTLLNLNASFPANYFTNNYVMTLEFTPV